MQRGPEAVMLAVKVRVERAGFKPEESADHSLCAGFLISGAEVGTLIFKLMEV